MPVQRAVCGVVERPLLRAGAGDPPGLNRAFRETTGIDGTGMGANAARVRARAPAAADAWIDAA